MYKGDRNRSAENESRITFSCGDDPIELNLNNAVSYTETSKFDPALLTTPRTWHMVVLHHKAKVSKRELLNELFSVVGNNEFFPIAYKRSDFHDKFLIRNCRPAIQRLFDIRLTLVLPRVPHCTVPITFKFNVAEQKYGQIYAAKRVELAVMAQFKKKEAVEDVPNVLNLERFGHHKEFVDIIVELRNKPAFDLVCKTISQNHDILNNINGLILSDNCIEDLSPIEMFSGADLNLIDLRNNNIRKISDLKHLANVNVTNLYIKGNPLASIPGYLENIKELFPNLEKLDGIPTKKGMSNKPAKPRDTVEINFEGETIQPFDTTALYKFKNSDMWHLVIIEHKGHFSKKEIIDALFLSTADILGEFYPCYYKIGGESDQFFIRNAFDHLEFFVANGLVLTMFDLQTKLPMLLKMNVSTFKSGQIEPSELLLQVASDQFNLIDRVLNLEEFALSGGKYGCGIIVFYISLIKPTLKGLKNMAISFANPRTLSSVLLSCAHRYLTNIVELRLGYNNISSCKGLHPLVKMKSLKVLDLSGNLIENVKELCMISKVTIKELRLDGNPLCKNYNFAGDYTKAIKDIFPELTKLDGVVISTSTGQFPIQKNFLCNIQAYDLVDQFVPTFFSAFDSVERIKLTDMYHPSAMLSFSMQYDQGKINSYIAPRIAKYSNLCRNLLKMGDFSRSFTSVYIGKDDIASAFKSLPQTEHDFCSFNCDTTIFTSHLVVITITGQFKELASSVLESDLLFHFSRTFILRPAQTDMGYFKSSTEYKIVNEVMQIFNPTPNQLKNAFKYMQPQDDCSIEATTAEEKESFIIMLREMTGLKPIWCSRFLGEGNWNFREALNKFLELLHQNQVPPNAFLEGKAI